MKRLLRRTRRERKRFWQKKDKCSMRPSSVSSLVAEQLETRLLLTTITLPAGSTDDAVFVYADAGESSPGDDVSVFNELRISTLSGVGPSKDVVVEVLNNRGENIPGSLGGVNGFPLFGGPGGVLVIDEVGDMALSISALATNPAGATYGITQTGVLVQITPSFNPDNIDNNDAGVAVIGEVKDTDQPAALDNEVVYSSFEAADFDPISGLLYAVVTGPTFFDALGNSDTSTFGQILITIDVNSGEAEAVGHNANGLADYGLSQIGDVALGTTITTIVYSQEAGHNNTEFGNTGENLNDGTSPVFLAFNTSGSGDFLVNQFVTISVEPAGGGSPRVDVQTDVIVTGDEDALNDAFIEGLMYGFDKTDGLHLFGLNGGENQVLVEVNLNAIEGEDVLTDVIEYTGLDLQGVSYDVINNVGYASDATSGILYAITTAFLIEDDGELVVEGGLADIYFMYIASSTPDVLITMTSFTVDDDGVITYTPTGGDPAFLFVDDDDADITTPDTAGGVMIGTRAFFRPDEEDPVWSPTTFFSSTELSTRDPGQQGAYPGGFFRPGIVVALDEFDKGQDIGKIQVGGGVFGDVKISGSVGTFYAGYLGTNVFEVDGDLNNLVVGTQAGGIEESDGSWASVSGSPIVIVDGEMGGFYSNDDWGLPIRVNGVSAAPSFPGVLDVSNSDEDTQIYVRGIREIERKVDGEADTVFFPFGALDANGDTDWIITNDSPLTAQPIGSVDGNISVFGAIEDAAAGDPSDNYSLGLLAGETITINAFFTGSSNFSTGHPADPTSQSSLGGAVTLFDPDLNEVANLGEVDVATGAELGITFTADQAGIYTIRVATIATAQFGYRLDIADASPMALGGGHTSTDLRHGLFGGSTNVDIQVVNGNMGSLSVGQIARSFTVQVDNGSLGGFRGGANGLAPGDLFSIDVPGDVPVMGFGLEIDDAPGNFGGSVSVSAGKDIGRVSSPMKGIIQIDAGRDVQSVRLIGDYSGRITAGRHIGVIRIDGSVGPGLTTDITTDVLFGFGNGIFANANADAEGLGSPGIIDAIIIGGNFGEAEGLFTEIPVSVGPSGGNLRFVDIAGNIALFRSGFTSSSWGPFSFEPGQSTVITDDSGALVRISPGFTGSGIDDFLFGAAPPVDEDNPDSEGGIITVKLLPVRDQLPDDDVGSIDETILGFAIAEITSTDGVRVSSVGGPVEIGVITVAGVEDDAVIISGPDPISVLEIVTTAPGVVADTGGTGTGTGTGTGISAVVTDGAVGITRIINRTVGGDLVSVNIGSPEDVPPGTDVGAGGGDGGDTGTDGTGTDNTGDAAASGLSIELVQVDGNLGHTQSTTGQIIESVIISTLDELEENEEPGDQTAEADPGGQQSSGLLSAVSIARITVTGSLGDVDVRGDVQRIEINAVSADPDDDGRGIGQFDGVAGAITIYGSLNRIELGDGISHPGTGRFARSGLFVYGELGTVEIAGAGRDIGGPIFSQQQIDRVRVSDGARITGYNATGFFSERFRGAAFPNPTIEISLSFDDFQLSDSVVVFSGGEIGLISVTGTDSEIRGAHIRAALITTIKVSGGANGIFDSRINALGESTDQFGTIKTILVGGQGIHHTLIAADRDLGKVTVQPGSTIEDSEIRGEFHVGKIIADEINRTDIDANNKLDKVTARESIFDLVIEAGELGQVKAGDDILGSAFFVAGPVKQIYAKGDFISTIEVTGPFGNLKGLKAGGDIGTPTGGEIIVDGQVGSIKAGEDFFANLLLNWDPTPIGPGNSEGPHQRFAFEGVELKSLKAGGRIIGLGDVGGDVGKIQSGGEFGQSGEELRVHGNFKSLTVGSKKTPADLESNLVVDADLGKVTVYGSTNGSIDVFGDFRSLTLKGTPANRANVNEDITVGGDFKKLTIVEGDVLANITAQGSGPKTNIKGSDIDGTIIVGGGPGTEIDIEGSITGTYVAQGDVDRIVLGGGIAQGAVVVIDGDLAILDVTGDIEGLVHITGNVGLIRAANIFGTTDSILDDLILDGVVTVGGNIGQLEVAGVVRDTYVLSGFDPGIKGVTDTDFDATELRIDGSGDDPLEGALAGHIDKVQVGVLYNSVIAAGVSPGANRKFGDLDGSDHPGLGQSEIGSVVLEAVVGNNSADSFGVFADSEIGSLRIGSQKFPKSTQVSLPSGFRSWIVEETIAGIDGFVFLQGLPFSAVIDGAFFTVTMSGPGVGEVLFDSDQITTIELTGTTAKTKIKVTAKGEDTIDVGRLFNGDDDELKQLFVDGTITEELTLGGDTHRLTLGGIDPGVIVTVAGDVKRADLGDLRGSGAMPSMVTFVGDVGRMALEQVTNDVSISAENIDRVKVRHDMAGKLSVTDAMLGQVKIGGDFSGIISSEGDIEKVDVKGLTGAEGNRLVQGVRASGDIGRFTTAGMSKAVVAAGGDFDQAKVKGDVAFSTLAAGLDIGADGVLSNLDGMGINQDVPETGDLRRVVINGDFIESNIVAGVNAGNDGFFGTDDDQLQRRAIEDVGAPSIIDVSFPDLFTIDVTFSDPVLPAMSDIEDVTIKGSVSGSGSPQESFAITAAGQIQSAFARREVFEKQGNIKRLEVDRKGVEPSSIEEENIDDLTTALAAAFQVRADGLDHVFGTSDDIIIFGDGDPNTDPDVFVTFNKETNTASFRKTDGFAVNSNGTNYYQITIDGDQVANRLGVNLDGEFNGQWPTGDEVPGGVFDYFFAVADLGDSVVTAFAPFAESFQENQRWNFQGQIGDNRDFGVNPQLDQDFIRLNGLEEGEILNLLLNDTGIVSSSVLYEVTLWKVDEKASDSNIIPVFDFNGRDDLDPPRSLVIPELDELAFVINSFVGYENIGQQFVGIDPIDFEITLLPNTLLDLNGLDSVSSSGSILDVNALTGHAVDSVWAIADFQPSSGVARKSLVRINNLSEDVGDPDPNIGATVTIADNPVGFDNIVGLEELNGVLYGVDAATNTLVTIGVDANVAASFGVATVVGNLNNDDLVITGLTVNPDGNGLMALHDQPVEVTDNLLNDALYDIDMATGQATLRNDLSGDAVRRGLAVQAGNLTLIGQPILGNPIGDILEISVNGDEEIEHVFGVDNTDLGNGVFVNSNATEVVVNKRLQEFVDAGFYYAFEIDFNPDQGDLTIDIADIEWLNDLQNGVIVDVVTDEPNFSDTVVTTGFDIDGVFNNLLITINTDGADGDVTIFFAGTADVEIQEPAGVSLGGAIIGQDNRDDLSPMRDLIIPNLDELTIAATTLDNGDFDALGYDSDQSLFSLIDTGNFDAGIITVTDPFNPNQTVTLTGQVLSEIYTKSFDEDVTFSDIRGVEFGRDNEVWTIVSVVDNGSERDSLLRIADILNPAAEMTLSIHNLKSDGIENDTFTDIRELAFAKLDPNLALPLGTLGLSDSLYGLDITTQTLVQIDARIRVTNASGSLVLNSNFGKAVAVGGEVGNLGDPGTSGANVFDVTGLAFDSSGRLLGIENNADIFVRFNTDSVAVPNSSRMQLLNQLPEGDYQAISFSNASGESFVSQVVSGDLLDDIMTIQVGPDQDTHAFGQTDTVVQGVTISSSANNDSDSVAGAGGFYRFDVSYATGGGDIVLTIEDIDWPSGSIGDIDSIFVDDAINVQIDSLDKDALTLTINSDSGGGDFQIFFGATSDLVSVSEASQLTFVDFVSGVGSVELATLLPDDGDYALQVTGSNANFGFTFFGFGFFNFFNFFASSSTVTGPAASYDLSVEVFDDGNSDFGITETTSGILVDPISPNSAAIDLDLGSSDLQQDPDDSTLYRNDHPDWPLTVRGTLLEPGLAGQVVIDSELGVMSDVDIYTLRLVEGQRITVDIEADTLFGRDDHFVIAGIYNGDLETITTTFTESDDVLSPAQQADSFIEAQAIFGVPNHDGVVIDPGDSGFSVYYVVVSNNRFATSGSIDEQIDYRLTITTTESEPVETPASQLVWLAFDGAQADFLGDFDPLAVNRTAFDASLFNLAASRSGIIQAVAARIEQSYRDAGLGPDEIQFTLDGKVTLNGDVLSQGQTFSSLIFGGRLPGLFGLAESVDRDNSDRTDSAVVLTDEIAFGLRQIMDEDDGVRFDETVNVLSFVGAHELGHILGLEHAVTVDAPDVVNIMPSGGTFSGSQIISGEHLFTDRNSDFQAQFVGFTNSIDILLRNIGSGTVIGE